MSEIGYKYNLMDLLSVIGIEQLKRLENNFLALKKLWETYHKHFNSKTFDIHENYGIKKKFNIVIIYLIYI